MIAANRGKYAETKVKAALKKLEAANIVHMRFPDAYAGSFTTAPADFMLLKTGKLTLIEVKEVSHDRRLPFKNFDPAQIARMRMWKVAGANTHVLIYHSTSKLWRVADTEWFFANHVKEKDGKAVGSWVLDEIPHLPSLNHYFEEFI